jgi:hypothetical protein
MSSISGGIIWSVASTAAIAAELAAAILAQAGQQSITLGLANAQETSIPYRPTEWSNPPLTSITLTTKSSVSTSQVDNLTSGPTGTIGSGQTTNQSAASTTASTISDVYVFDAVIRIDHSQQIRTTDHPVQSGASISDHALILPARVVMEIGMSDAMDAYAPGVWTGSPSKSVSAYQTLVALQQGRQPLTVTTRLATYANMLIELIQAPDTKETRTGLKAMITFKQIFNGTVTLTPVSDRPQTTDSTSIGAKQAMPISSSDLQRFTTLLPTTVPGAGDISSRTTSDGS